MIVLGESVVQLIQTLADHPTPEAWPAAALAFVIICTFWWMYFDLGSTSTVQHIAGRSYAVIRDVLLIGHWIGILGLVLLAAGVGNAIEEAGNGAGRATLAGLCVGAMLYHGAAALISLRWGSPIHEVAISTVPALGVPGALLVFAAGWPVWLVLAVLLAETLLHFWLGGRTVRRQLREAAHGQSLDG
jgi:low temperature requirement protein LtrA